MNVGYTKILSSVSKLTYSMPVVENMNERGTVAYYQYQREKSTKKNGGKKEEAARYKKPEPL